MQSAPTAGLDRRRVEIQNAIVAHLTDCALHQVGASQSATGVERHDENDDARFVLASRDSRRIESQVLEIVALNERKRVLHMSRGALGIVVGQRSVVNVATVRAAKRLSNQTL